MAQPSSYKLQENEIEVTLDFEQEAEAAAGGSSFGEGSRNGSDKLKHQSIPDDNDDVIFVGVVKQRGTNMKAECSGSHGGSGDPQQEEQKLATARDPPARRTRPRIQLGLTPRQLRELEAAFEKTKYPDVITRYAACSRSNPDFHPLGSPSEGPSPCHGPSHGLNPKA